jgi:hypothetical protein
VLRLRDPVSSHTPSPSVVVEPFLEPDFREPEEDENSFSTILDSLIPFIRDNKEAIKLPIFLGKRALDIAGSSEDTSLKTKSAREGKDIAWSRGIGL